MQISACIICKNEEQYIGKCIQALRALPVHIVVADTGSTDNTLSILEKLLTSNDTLCHFEWCNDFSMARNFCAIQAQTDWIWMVDADEILTSCDSVVLHDFLEKKENVDKIGTILRKDAYPLQGEIAFATSRMGRIYNRNYYHYEGTIHEQLTPCNCFTDSSDTALQEICYVDLPLFFNHMGYETMETLRKKCKRNISLLETAFAAHKDPYLAYQLGQAYAALGEHQTAIHYFEIGLTFDLDPRLEYVQTMVQSYGYSLLALKQYQKALSFTGIYDAFATNADFIFLMGLIYMNNAMFSEAIAEFDKASLFKTCIVDGTNSYRASYNKGVILECLGRLPAAIKSYQACGSFQPALARLEVLRS